MPPDDAIARLARQIDAARIAERPLQIRAEEVAALRRQGAVQLHQICASFVASLNSKLVHARLELSPPTFAPEMFQASGVNLFQIGSQGREMQITFQATPQPFSTEKFLIPYTLEGELRAYNQKMLERFEVRTQALFYCLEDESATWRFFDWRGPQTAVVDTALLTSLMERLF